MTETTENVFASNRWLVEREVGRTLRWLFWGIGLPQLILYVLLLVVWGLLEYPVGESVWADSVRFWLGLLRLVIWIQLIGSTRNRWLNRGTIEEMLPIPGGSMLIVLGITLVPILVMTILCGLELATGLLATLGPDTEWARPFLLALPSWARWCALTMWVSYYARPGVDGFEINVAAAKGYFAVMLLTLFAMLAVIVIVSISFTIMIPLRDGGIWDGKIAPYLGPGFRVLLFLVSARIAWTHWQNLRDDFEQTVLVKTLSRAI